MLYIFIIVVLSSSTPPKLWRMWRAGAARACARVNVCVCRV